MGVSVTCLFEIASRYNMDDKDTVSGTHYCSTRRCTPNCVKGALDYISEDMEAQGKKSSVIDDLPADHKGPANFFVSHTWGHTYWDLITAIADEVERRGQDANKTFVWIDMYCLNQFRNRTFTQQWLQTTFNDHIKNIGAMMLIATREFCLLFYK